MMRFMLFAIFALLILTFSNAFERKPESYRQELIKKSAEIAKVYKNEFKKFMVTKQKSKIHEHLSSILKAPPRERMVKEFEDMSLDDSNLLCTVCWSAAGVFLDYRQEGKNETFLDEIAYSLCVDFELMPPHVCRGLVSKHLVIFLYITDNRKSLREQELCGLLLQGSNCGGTAYDWSIDIDQGEKVVKAKSEIPASGPNDLTIVQITDLHVDHKYKAGADVKCAEPVCCRSYNSNRNTSKIFNAESAAGRWGDYNECDTPFEVYENAMETVKSSHKNIDYIYFTGDIVDHGVWETSRQDNRFNIHQNFQVLKDLFPTVPVYPIIGNHEPDPLNVFAPAYVHEDRPDLSTQWLYDLMAEQWSTWLPESALETVRKGGYYTISPRKGFRIIALNNNECYTINFWLLFDPAYPKIQLQWLHDTLLQAEKDGEYVHILAHMPSGAGSYLHSCGKTFRKIVERFHKIIGGTFAGHTHYDEFSILYSSVSPKLALNVIWNGGSITPFSNVNPNYRIYSVEPETYQVSRHETYLYNITAANLTPEKTPEWYKSYSLVEEYGIKDLSPNTLDGLVHNFAADRELLHRYWQHKIKHADTSLQNGCDNSCYEHHLCELVVTQADDIRNCNELLAIFNKNFK